MSQRYDSHRWCNTLNVKAIEMHFRVVALVAITTAITELAHASMDFQENNKYLGLPATATSIENSTSAQKNGLGQMLFFDKRLSGDGTISCASCHLPEHAFSDGLPVAQGIHQTSGTRNTPSILNAAYNSFQFWDGRRNSLEDQALDPLLNPREHGLVNQEKLLEIIRSDDRYVQQFKEAFAVSREEISPSLIADALARFEKNSLIAGNSAFDRYYYRGDNSALSASAIRGLKLFQGHAKCTSCHEIGKTSALFTDNDFHSLSVGLKRIEAKLPELTTQLIHLRNQHSEIDQAILNDRDLAELGRFAITMKPADIGKFRTPSLRNVALTAPYMHDGSIATLEEAVDIEIYYRGSESGNPLILTPMEKNDLVEFLKSLNSTIEPHQLDALQHHN